METALPARLFREFSVLPEVWLPPDPLLVDQPKLKEQYDHDPKPHAALMITLQWRRVLPCLRNSFPGQRRENLQISERTARTTQQS